MNHFFRNKFLQRIATYVICKHLKTPLDTFRTLPKRNKKIIIIIIVIIIINNIWLCIKNLPYVT